MKKGHKEEDFDEKLDLRHDTLEFAETDDELLDEPDVLDLGEDEISAVELDFLENEEIDAQAAALVEVEKDRLADADYLETEEDWTDDLNEGDTI